ncbi:MAG: hypothetical protein ACT4UQ_01370 [Gammaproteobacteria bacterium]
MNLRSSRWMAWAVASLLAAPGAFADDIRPESRNRPPGTARAFADEKCIEQCDSESDKCMQDSNGDPDKVQVCDDKYSECLAACEE